MFLVVCAAGLDCVCDLLLFGECTGRWYGTWVAIASDLTGVANKCDILADSVCSRIYWCV